MFMSTIFSSFFFSLFYSRLVQFKHWASSIWIAAFFYWYFIYLILFLFENKDNTIFVIKAIMNVGVNLPLPNKNRFVFLFFVFWNRFNFSSLFPLDFLRVKNILTLKNGHYHFHMFIQGQPNWCLAIQFYCIYYSIKQKLAHCLTMHWMAFEWLRPSHSINLLSSIDSNTCITLSFPSISISLLLVLCARFFFVRSFIVCVSGFFFHQIICMDSKMLMRFSYCAPINLPKTHP